MSTDTYSVSSFFSNITSRDPCIARECHSECPVGFTCQRIEPGRIIGELRIDFCGCNLNCLPCWADYSQRHRYSSEEIVQTILCRSKKLGELDTDLQLRYIRITGGEPLINRNRMLTILSIIEELDDQLGSNNILRRQWRRKINVPHSLRGRREIKIQTNGASLVSRTDQFLNGLSELERIGVRFEVSFKGTNQTEFENLMGSAHSARSFLDQMNGFQLLLTLEDELPIFTRAILGLYHSRECDIVYPGTSRRMMLFADWDENFRELLVCLNEGYFGGDRIALEPIRFTSRLNDLKTRCQERDILAPPRIGMELRLKPGRKKYIKKNKLGRTLPIGFSANDLKG